MKFSRTSLAGLWLIELEQRATSAAFSRGRFAKGNLPRWD